MLKVLSVGTRVRIVQLLKGRSLCVNALAARLDVTQGAVSQHLRILRDAGWVIAERRGYFVHYRLNPKKLARCRTLVEQLLDMPDETGCSCAKNSSKAGGSKTDTEKSVKGRREPCAKKSKAARSRKS